MPRSAPKDERIAMRVTPKQKETIEAAARALGRTVSDFATHAAVTSAEDALADRRVFHLADEHWDAFERTLTAPLPDVQSERLAGTLAARAVFKQP